MQTRPMAIDAVWVLLPNKEDEDILVAPDKVDKMMTGIAILLFKPEYLSSAFWCSQARPLHLSPSEAIRSSNGSDQWIFLSSSSILLLASFLFLCSLEDSELCFCFLSGNRLWTVVLSSLGIYNDGFSSEGVAVRAEFKMVGHSIQREGFYLPLQRGHPAEPRPDEHTATGTKIHSVCFQRTYRHQHPSSR